MGTYVTATGFKRKTLQEIRSEIETGFKEVFGPDFETSVDSPNGLLISQMALPLSKVWELAQEIFISRDPDEATGIALDFNAALNGLFRKTAEACKVEALLFTEDATATIPAGSQAMRTRGNLLFDLDEDVSIDRTSCEKLLIVDDGSQAATNYVFNFTFGTVTLNNQNPLVTNLDALASAIYGAGGKYEYLSSDHSEGLLVYVENGNVGITGNLPDDFIIYAGTTGNFTAESTGAQTCEVGELNDIPRSVSGFDKVYNKKAGVAGTDTETDNQLRIRRQQSAQAIKSTATDPAIAAHLLAEVDGVTAAVVVSNREFTEDSEGRPGKCFETMVVGGSDEDVARKIWENMPSGIKPWGNTEVQITDENGDGQIIAFSRPQAKFLWVKVTYKLYNEEIFPGEDSLKAAILKWAESEYNMGQDVIPDRVYSALYPPYINGVGQASIEVAVTDSAAGTPSYGTSVIPISRFEYANLATARISLTQQT